MTYFNSLVYVVGLIFCLHFVVEKKLPFIRMLIFSVIYACIHYFMMIDGMFDANQYILVIISIVMLDWLMLCWLYGKMEFWLLFYSTIYFGLYVVGQNIILSFLLGKIK